jgi:16S rRNA (guanine1207-N2)-methyltransferase
MSIPKTHYFDPAPKVASKPHTVRLHANGVELELQADRGVFGARRVDLGTLVLLKEAPAPPSEGEILDLGAGYGPIAIVLARAAPRAHVWAVDVNERANELAKANSEAAGVAANVTVATPDQVPDDVRFAAIYSNPPVRVGKAALHEILDRWLDRLVPGGAAYLVVQRNLGSDSLAAWLAASGRSVERLKSKKGYRILQVKSG